LLDKLKKDNKLEIAFVSAFSALIIVLFYALISMNGLVLGNDPAVHLAKSQTFLKTGQIPLNNIGWIPPLFEILLAMATSLSGANNVGQMIFVEKALAVTVNWLLFLSVYIVGSKFFNKKIGAVAAVFLSMCYPIYFLNTWGGYTTALGMAFLLLLFYSSYWAVKQFGYIVVTFLVAFSIALSHQLTAFLAVVIMLPVTFLMTIKFKGAYIKVFIATIIAAFAAFFTFYYPAIKNYLDIAIYHVFFGNKNYLEDIPYIGFQSFLLYFGFIQFLAIGGIGISYYLLKRQKKSILFITLVLSLFVPLFFAESYVFGFLLPFEWFTYYLAPPIAILAAVCVVFTAQKLSANLKNRYSLSKKWFKIASFLLIGLACCVIVFQSWNIYSEIMYDASVNSIADINAYDAAVWLNQNYPDDNSTIVSTRSPGDWFAFFSGKNVVSQTYDWEGANLIADSVLNFDYKMQNPQTIVKAYETNGYTADDYYVSINQLWRRVSSSSLDGDFLSYNKNGVDYSFALSDLNRIISFDDQSNPKAIEFRFFNDQVALTQAIFVQNDSCSINVSWSLFPLNGELSNVKLYLTVYLDLQFNFDKVQIPQVMDWVNPWDMPSKFTNGNEWATVNFSTSVLFEHYVGLYDQQKQTAFAFYFTDVPDWGNIGALSNRQIDAVRYQYDFNKIGANQTVTRQYQLLTLAKDSYPTLQPDELLSLFNLKSSQFPVSIHNYKEYIAEENIGFIVFDKNQFDVHTSLPLGSSFLPQLAKCQFLELVYSNSRIAIFKVLSNYNQTQVWK
jgi:hypothetical protein